MSDLKERFDVLDRLEPPDIWPEAERRHPGTTRIPRRPGRGLAAMLAFAVAAAGIAVAVRAFTGTTPRPPSPPLSTTTKSNGSIYFRAGGADGPGSIRAVEPDGTGERIVFPADSSERFHRISFSPDGTRIAFDNDLSGEDGIETANPDGTDVVRLTSGVNDSWPSWSPDASAILFSSTRYDPNIDRCAHEKDFTCPTDLYVMDIDGSNVQRLTTHDAPEYEPVWSPDGTRIAFVRAFSGSQTAIFSMKPDGSDIRRVSTADGGSDFSPSWSPEGSRLAFAAIRREDWGIWVVDADGTGEHLILGMGTGYKNDPVWSPDGTRIAFIGNLTEANGNSLYVMRPDGSGVSQLTDLQSYGVEAEIAWQPIPGGPSSPSPAQAAARVTATIPISAFPNSILVGEGSVWVSGQTEEGGTGDLVRLDPATGDVLARIPMRGIPTWEVGGGGMAVGLGSIWVVSLDEEGTILQRIDPASNRLADVIPVLPGTSGADVWVDETGIWVLVFGAADTGMEVVRIDPETFSVGDPITLETRWAHWLFRAGRSVWVLGDAPEPGRGVVVDTLYRIDPSTGRVTTITLPDSSWTPAVSGDSVWLSLGDNRIVELDASTATVGPPIQVPVACCYDAFAGDGSGGVWVANTRVGATFSHVSSDGVVDAAGTIAPDEYRDWAGVAWAFDPSTNSIWVVHYRDSVSRIEISGPSTGTRSSR
ncbi:MAG TPA: hypothetical protein VGB19_13620 [Actinomycetota bacterium]